MQAPELTPRGLERRIKRHLTGAAQHFAAITTPGFEPYTCKEIAALDGAVIGTVEKGIVEFSGPFNLIYHANLCSRTASRILLRIDSFTARSYPELYNKLYRIDWELYVGYTPLVFFTASSVRSRLHHTDRIAESSFSALRDHMHGLGIEATFCKSAVIKFVIRFIDDTCTVSIDASGELLYKRGYRTATGKAPLRETTAAALLAAAQWEQYAVIADPCCGSGALPLEATLCAANVPPGSSRDFAFYSWPSFSRPAWENCKRRLCAAPPGGTRPRLIYAGDIDTAALERLKRNSASLPVGDRLVVAHADCLTFNGMGEFGRTGLVISNLPYGKRIDAAESNIDEFYFQLGRSLKKFCSGWDFAFLVADTHFERKARLRGETILSFSNGGIGVRLVKGTIT